MAGFHLWLRDGSGAVPGFQPAENTFFYARGIYFENAAQFFLAAMLNEFIRQADTQQSGSMPKFKGMFGDHTAKTSRQSVFFNGDYWQIAPHRISEHFNIKGSDKTWVDKPDADPALLKFLGCNGGRCKSMAKRPDRYLIAIV